MDNWKNLFLKEKFYQQFCNDKCSASIRQLTISWKTKKKVVNLIEFDPNLGFKFSIFYWNVIHNDKMCLGFKFLFTLIICWSQIKKTLKKHWKVDLTKLGFKMLFHLITNIESLSKSYGLSSAEIWKHSNHSSNTLSVAQKMVSKLGCSWFKIKIIIRYH